MRRVSLFLVLSMMVVSSFSIFIPQKASAISGGEFQAGRIMDDGIFFSSSNINPDGIQAFLNSKVPVCDTNGTQPYAGTTRAAYAASKGYPAPFTCLKDYVQDTSVIQGEAGLCNGFSGGRKSAAQIIYEVGQSCGINPKVLLVLLQKEQALITDDWPWGKQYNAATGYFCPDTAPCNPEYAGFFKQVYYGARQFKRYGQTPDQWGYRAGRVNYIQYSPNAACSGSNVFIQNQATAGLYVYTPYQPNPAALSVVSDSSPGGEVNCGAYGNRNFWWQYNAWFGSTLGALIKSTSSNALYYTEGQKRFAVPSMAIANQFNLGLTDVRFISDAEMNSIPIASSPFSSSLGQVAKSESDTDSDGGALYLISNGFRIPFASLSQFTDFGFNTNNISYLPLSTLQRLPQSAQQLSNYVQAPDQSVYKIEAGKMRAIFEISKLVQLNPSGNVTSLSQFTFSNWDFGTPIVDGDYVVIGPDNGIRVYNSTNYFDVPSLPLYDCWNLGSVKTFRVGLYSVAGGTDKGNLTCFSQKTNNEIYMMGKTQKYLLSSNANLSISKPSDSLINSIPTGTLKTVIKSTYGNELSILENNKKRSILNMTAFSQLNLGAADITTLPEEAYRTIPYGPRILPLGQTVIEPSGALSVVTSLAGRTQVASIRQYIDYAYDTVNPLPVNSSEQLAYGSSGTLPTYLRTASDLYLVDEKVRYLVPTALDVPYGINRSSLPIYSQTVVDKTLPWTLTKFIKSKDSPAIYYVENGARRPISSWTRVEQLGGGNQIDILSNQAVNNLPLGPAI